MRGDTRLRRLPLCHNNASGTWEWRAGEVQNNSEVCGELFQSFLFPLFWALCQGLDVAWSRIWWGRSKGCTLALAEPCWGTLSAGKRGKALLQFLSGEIWGTGYTEPAEQFMAAQLALDSIQARSVMVGEGDKGETGKVEFDLGTVNGFKLSKVMIAGKWSDCKNAVLSCVQTAPLPSLEIILISWGSLQRPFTPCVYRDGHWFLVEAANPEQPWEIKDPPSRAVLCGVSSGYSGGMQEEFWRRMPELAMSPGFDSIKPFQ